MNEMNKNNMRHDVCNTIFEWIKYENGEIYKHDKR